MEGITTRETECGTQFVCADCGRWCRDGGKIVHSSRCDTKGAQPFAAESKPVVSRTAHRAIREGAISAIMSDDEIVDAVASKHVSMADAMNRDY
jgi:hypothetical protein